MSPCGGQAAGQRWGGCRGWLYRLAETALDGCPQNNAGGGGGLAPSSPWPSMWQCGPGQPPALKAAPPAGNATDCSNLGASPQPEF